MITMSTPHGLGPTRARVLAYLQAATEPRSVIDVAAELALHKNSARFHLDALVESGYAERAVNATGSQGRPPLVFTATSAAPTIGNLHLTELLQVLISSFIQPIDDSGKSAERAGHTWGATVAGQEEQKIQGLGTLAVHLGERGFGTSHECDSITFTRCPFRSAVPDDQLPLVCAIHKGFLDGYLDASGSDVITQNLTIGPRDCRATFSARPTAPGPTDAQLTPTP